MATLAVMNLTFHVCAVSRAVSSYEIYLDVPFAAMLRGLKDC